MKVPNPTRRRKCRNSAPGLLLLITLGTSNHQQGVDAFFVVRQDPRRRNRYCSTTVTVQASRDTLPSVSPSSSQTTSEVGSLSQDSEEESGSTFSPVSLLIPFSLLLAVGLIAWEDYGASNLWPSRHMIASTSTSIQQHVSNKNSDDNNDHPLANFGAKTIHGLGFGKTERLRLLEQAEADANSAASASASSPLSSSLLPEIRTYNEVMKEHRMERVSRWQELAAKTSNSESHQSEQQIEGAVQDLQQILLDVLKLQVLVNDYQWSQAHDMIQSSIIPKLEPAATILRQKLSSSSDDYNVGYEDIGFDWGSCAWRHCGALADAQEALDELDHLLGVLEPPECLFCLNVVERSIRDMLAVVPAQYHALEGIPAYIPYQSVNAAVNDDAGEEGTDVLDQEYLRMLGELRSNTAEATLEDD